MDDYLSSDNRHPPSLQVVIVHVSSSVVHFVLSSVLSIYLVSRFNKLYYNVMTLCHNQHFFGY